MLAVGDFADGIWVRVDVSAKFSCTAPMYTRGPAQLPESGNKKKLGGLILDLRAAAESGARRHLSIQRRRFFATRVTLCPTEY